MNPFNQGQPQGMQPRPNLAQMRQQFEQDPRRYLGGLDIPEGMTDAEQIVRHLASTGQVPPMLRDMVNAKIGGR